jgi:hypothetical protein
MCIDKVRQFSNFYESFREIETDEKSELIVQKCWKLIEMENNSTIISIRFYSLVVYINHSIMSSTYSVTLNRRKQMIVLYNFHTLNQKYRGFFFLKEHKHAIQDGCRSGCGCVGCLSLEGEYGLIHFHMLKKHFFMWWSPRRKISDYEPGVSVHTSEMHVVITPKLPQRHPHHIVDPSAVQLYGILFKKRLQWHQRKKLEHISIQSLTWF